MAVTECGEITRESCYMLSEFQKRTGMKRDAMRTARRAGLKVRYLHGRGFVLGSDWLAYLESQTTENQLPGIKCGEVATSHQA